MQRDLTDLTCSATLFDPVNRKSHTAIKTGMAGVWLVVLILYGVHQEGTTSADTCCEYDRSHSIFSCQGCLLTEVPNDIPDDVVILDLSNNNLTIVKDGAFSRLSRLEKLYLSNNQIENFDGNALHGLTNLTELDLRRNQLCISDANFNGVFNHTPHLRTLQLANSDCNETASGYIDQAISPLKELEKLSLAYVKDANLGPAFGNLKTLKYLMLLGSSIDGGTLGCNAFKALENVSLEMLSLRNSGINNICAKALHPLKKLKYLNLACNADLLYINVVEAVNNLPASTLETIIVDRIGGGVLSIDTSQIVPSSAWRNVKKLSARFLNTGHIFLRNTGFWHALPELRYVGLPVNMIWFDYSDKEGIIHILNTTKMETIDIGHYGGQGYSEEQFYNNFCYPDNIHEETDLFFYKPPEDIFPPITPGKNDFELNATLYEDEFIMRNMPLSVKYVYTDFFTFGMMDIFQINFNPMNQMVLFNISNSNFFGHFKSMKNMTNLQIIDARNCGFNNLDRKPLHYPSLRKLLLSGNNLKNIGSPNVNWTPFQELKELKHLDLTDNDIDFIKQNTFKNLPLLEELRLQKNHITALNFDLTGSPEVRLIDVSQNKITFVSETFMNSVDHVANMHAVSLDLTENMLVCECPSLQFVKWFQETQVEIVNYHEVKCQDGIHIHAINTNKMAWTCYMTRTHLSVVLPTIVPTAFVVFMVALVYRKRWKIQFRYYLLKDYLRRRTATPSATTGNDDCEIIQDENEPINVFISCSEEDSNWLYEEVIPRIEVNWGYITFSRRRDVKIGDCKTSIAVAMNSAAIHMCVISPNFCEDNLCLWELEMILARGEESVFFIYKEEIDPRKYSYVSKITQHYNHLEHGNVGENGVCWDKLKQVICKAIGDADVSP